MGISSESKLIIEPKLIIKNTFLEFVVDEDSKKSRSFTDGAIGFRDRETVQTQDASDADVGKQDDLQSEARGDEQQDHFPTADQVLGAVPDCMMVLFPGLGHEPQYQIAVGMGAMAPVAMLPAIPTLPQWTQPDAHRAPLILANHVSASTPSTEGFTTLMLRNVPNQYTRDMLVDLLNSEGFAGTFSFVYLPIDFKTHAGLGYAFVDLISPQYAETVREHFEGFNRWALRSEKVCSVSWSHPGQQGCAAHVDRYRNSPVMHEIIHDSWKPALYSGGRRVPFPPPTKKLRNPHIRTPGAAQR